MSDVLAEFNEEVIWADSGTGDAFQCVHHDYAVELRAEIEQLRAALKPFAYEYTILMQQQDGFPAWHSVQTKHLLEASRALAGTSDEQKTSCGK